MIARLLGKLLQGRHAGDRHLLWNDIPIDPGEAMLGLSSDAFEDGASIPRRCAGKGVGDNASPQLSWTQVPEDAAELILVVEDPDAPLRRPFVHLIAAGIPASTAGIAEGMLCAGNASSLFVLGLTTFHKAGYSGPRPLPGHGAHRYVFQLFALNQQSTIESGTTRDQLVSALVGKIIARGRLEGYFEQK